jgi:RNA polymerase sigma-70 factor (ECF subfamily)
MSLKQETFIEHIKLNEGIIFKISKVYSNNSEEQKDLYQEVVYQLWKSFESFRNESKVSTWIYRIALNTCLTYVKKKSKKVRQVEMDLSMISKIDSVDDNLDEQIRELYKHIQRLNSVEKGIVLLYLEGNSYAEIASITGFSESNVGTRLNRVKTKLKSQIKK